MKRITKLVIGAMAVAVLGTGYFAKTTDYRRIPEIAGLFNRVVMHKENYEQTLLNELGKTNEETVANGMIDAGYLARKRINFSRIPAEDFSQSPYDLRIAIEHNPEGDEAYLVDLKSKDKLPIYRSNHVGGIGHNIVGIYGGAEREISNILTEIQETAVETVDCVIKKFENE